MRQQKTHVLGTVLVGFIALLGGCVEGGGSSSGTACSPNILPSSDDPLYPYQWHLKNTGQHCGTPGVDINVESVWSTNRGAAARIVIVDDGLEIAHEDIAANIVSGMSYDFSAPGYGDPTGSKHGTAVAGIAAAVGYNGIGVIGVAPAAELVGYNLLVNLTDSNEASAMTLDQGLNSVSSNSWGPNDGTGLVADSSNLWRAAIDDGVGNGRGGNGLVYVWAGGNGAGSDYEIDNANYDGYANYYGVMAVGAVTDTGIKTSYSEKGANLWVVAPAGEFCSTGPTITTTDRSDGLGYNNAGFNFYYGNIDYPDGSYTKCFNGTSAAAPVVSGVVALVLDANPGLTWRDVRELLAQTAVKNDSDDPDWAVNGAGLNVNHKYGFGLINAAAAVSAAMSRSPLVTPLSIYGPVGATPSAPIPDGVGDYGQFGTAVSDTVTVSGSGIGYIEYVEILFTSDHAEFGDLEITLTSPAGTESRLADLHRCGTCGAGYSSGWRFGSARHLGELADGEWRLTVRDGWRLKTGSLVSWQLRFYGR